MLQDILKSRKVQKLINSYKRPSLTEVGPILREAGITSVREFWDMFDKIQHLWADSKSKDRDNLG